MDVLQLYYPQDAIVVTAGRGAKPLSQVAENMTIVTAQEIEEMNAHTVSDVLQHLTGVQLTQYSSPGDLVLAYVQGASYWHVKVTIDGVPLNNLSDNAVDVGSLPVQFIQRLEIIKGPASSTWGSALGGIINIITKEPDESGHPKGLLFGSLGEGTTWDGRAEITSRHRSIGYYLYGGGLGSQGVGSRTSVTNGNAYGKLQWNISDRTVAQQTVAIIEADRDRRSALRNSLSYRILTTGISSSYADWLEWNASVRGHEQEQQQRGGGSRDSTRDRTLGATLSAVARTGRHTFTGGAEIDWGTLRSNIILGGQRRITKGGVYLSGTIVAGPVTFTPGIRHDTTSTNGDFTSPSFGITWLASDDLILRGIVARGFNLPGLFGKYGDSDFFERNRNLRMEEVVSYQVGAEANVLSLLNLKSTLFRCDTSRTIVQTATDDGNAMLVNGEARVRQGIEVEARTHPVNGATFGFGYSFIDNRDASGMTVPGTPRITWNTSVEYRRNKFFGTIHGKYIRWNELDGLSTNGFVTDVAFNYSFPAEEGQVELFFNLNNLFDTPQHLTSEIPGAGRWLEGGLRWKF